MSAIEHPAARSGRTTFWCGAQSDVGALGHEVHAAEDDELGLAAAGRGARQLQRIAGEVGELDDLVALIVMPEDDEPLAERLLRRGDAGVHLVVREAEVVLRERLALADALLLDLSEEFYVHGSVVSRQSSVVSRSRQSQSSVPVGSRSRSSVASLSRAWRTIDYGRWTATSSIDCDDDCRLSTTDCCNASSRRLWAAVTTL